MIAFSIHLLFRLWEDGWKDRYYESKFAVGSEDIAFRQTVVRMLMQQFAG